MCTCRAQVMGEENVFRNLVSLMQIDSSTDGMRMHTCTTHHHIRVLTQPHTTNKRSLLPLQT